ncbi:MAG: hypothetical protein AABY93_14310 [Bacteroidota bacterium]
MKKLFYAGIFVLFVVFGLTAYRQNEKAEIYREEKNKMHQALIRMRSELQSSKLEAAKLWQIIEAEKKNTQRLVQDALKKK